jgi:hypothetical protein
MQTKTRLAATPLLPAVVRLRATRSPAPDPKGPACILAACAPQRFEGRDFPAHALATAHGSIHKPAAAANGLSDLEHIGID